MKNWLLLVLGPALAILTTPARLCRSPGANSVGNGFAGVVASSVERTTCFDQVGGNHLEKLQPVVEGFGGHLFGFGMA